MAVLRFTRDKRGYEHFYLVQPPQRRDRGPARVLYWFRTPPNVKVGREPFDEAIRRELEAQNPGVAFDWRRILETPIPSADAEKWRERRRAERAVRQARRAQAPESRVEPALTEGEAPLDEETPPEMDAPVHVLEAAAEAVGVDPKEPEAASADPVLEVQPVTSAVEASGVPPTGIGDGSQRRRRRRRRRRGGHRPAGSGGGAAGGAAGGSGGAGGDV